MSETFTRLHVGRWRRLTRSPLYTFNMDGIDLYNGDCLDIMPQLPAHSVDLAVIDPPYNASVEDSDLVDILKDRRPGKNAGKREYGKWDYGFDPAPAVKQLDMAISKDGQAYVFCSTHLLAEWMFGLRDCFDGIRVINWAKPDPVPSVRQRHWCSANELIVWVWRGRYTFNFLGHKSMYSWQLYPSPKTGTRLHPNQKPLALIQKLIQVSSDIGQTVMDCYMGSGTTGEAAIRTGRRFIGIEKDAGYFATAKRRIESAQPSLFGAVYNKVLQPTADHAEVENQSHQPGLL